MRVDGIGDGCRWIEVQDARVGVGVDLHAVQAPSRPATATSRICGTLRSFARRLAQQRRHHRLGTQFFAPRTVISPDRGLPR